MIRNNGKLLLVGIFTMANIGSSCPHVAAQVSAWQNQQMQAQQRILHLQHQYMYHQQMQVQQHLMQVHYQQMYYQQMQAQQRFLHMQHQYMYHQQMQLQQHLMQVHYKQTTEHSQNGASLRSAPQTQIVAKHNVVQVKPHIDPPMLSPQTAQIPFLKSNPLSKAQASQAKQQNSAPKPMPQASPPVLNIFQKSLGFTLAKEAGYVNDPVDPGGATNRGVTQKTYDVFRRSKGQKSQSVKQISDAEVRDVYSTMYWTPSGADRLPPALAMVQFDTAVNFGVGGASKRLDVIQKQKYGSDLDAARAYVQLRIDYRYQRVREDPSMQKFLQGWLNRDRDLLAFINANFAIK